MEKIGLILPCVLILISGGSSLFLENSSWADIGQGEDQSEADTALLPLPAAPGVEPRPESMDQVDRAPQSETSGHSKGHVKVVYAKKTELDLDAMQIQGELKSPGDFYFQVKPEDKMDSLVMRRKNFHRQMLRDVMFSK